MKTHSLTLKEAVESGKSFRYKGCAWILPGTISLPDYYNIDEILSSNWEIQVKDSFTRADVERAVMKVVNDHRVRIDLSTVSYKGLLELAMNAAESGDMAGKESV